MIMVGAGTGLAPFRGFLQERAAQRASGVPVATSLLFFGCRTSEDDYLYADELRALRGRRRGQVDAVFSREGVQSDATFRTHHRTGRTMSGISSQQRANIYVCGNANTMAPGVRTALIQVFRMKSGVCDGRQQLARRFASRRTVPGRHLGRLRRS